MGSSTCHHLSSCKKLQTSELNRTHRPYESQLRPSSSASRKIQKSILKKPESSRFKKWPKRDSNSHILRHDVLSVACISIPPFGRTFRLKHQRARALRTGIEPARPSGHLIESQVANTITANRSVIELSRHLEFELENPD